MALTVRTDEKSDKFINWAKKFTREKTASKAIFSSIEELQKINGDWCRCLREIDSLKRENALLKQTIENARISALAFSDAISQDDLLSNRND